MKTRRGSWLAWSGLAAFASISVVVACSSSVEGFGPTLQGGDVGFAPIPDDAAVPGRGFALDGEVVAKPSRPMVTGTLALTNDGKFAIAADSERDVIVVVDLPARKALTVALEPGDEPGRTIVGRRDDAGPHAYTVLRRSAAIVDLDVASATPSRVPTCTAPRGITYDDATNRVHVACATGELVTYDATTWEPTRHLAVARDLRDVVVTETGVLVSRFSSAELLDVAEDGHVTLVTRPELPPECASPTVMHRLLAHDGRLYAVHQLASDRVVLGRNGTSDCEVAQVTPAFWRASLSEVAGLSESTAGDFWAQFATVKSGLPPLEASVQSPSADHYLARLDGAAGPMDLAVGESGKVVVLVSGNHWTIAEPTVLTWKETGDTEFSIAGARVAGMLTSVAVGKDDKWIAQSREPAGLYIENDSPIFFGGASVNNTGYSLFHMNAGSGVACASCHPEGGQDEHVWHFPRGARRTLSLDANYNPNVALNWSGTWPTFYDLMSNVFNQQMAHDHEVRVEQTNVLVDWISALPGPTPGVIVAPAAVERGRRLFSGSAGCAVCHMGSDHSDFQFYDFGTGGTFKTPSLLGVGARSRLMHDGCASSLRDVFGACGGGPSHNIVDRLPPQDVDDVVAFLMTL